MGGFRGEDFRAGSGLRVNRIVKSPTATVLVGLTKSTNWLGGSGLLWASVNLVREGVLKSLLWALLRPHKPRMSAERRTVRLLAYRWFFIRGRKRCIVFRFFVGPSKSHGGIIASWGETSFGFVAGAPGVNLNVCRGELKGGRGDIPLASHATLGYGIDVMRRDGRVLRKLSIRGPSEGESSL